ncbi:ion channel [Sphingomonas sp. UYAg733]
MRRLPPILDRRLALRRRSATPPWLLLPFRVALAFALIGVALAIFWFDRDGLRDNADGAISFTDVLYFIMITITSVGYGDIVPVSDQARMFDSFLVTPTRLFIWLIFLGTAYDFLLKGVWERWRMKVIQQKLHGHIMVVGYDTSGMEAGSELTRRGTDASSIVVIDDRPAALEAAQDSGVTIIDADYLAASDGRVALHERRVRRDEVGEPLAAIATGVGLRVYRADDCYGCSEPEADRLQGDDLPIEIVPKGEVKTGIAAPA